MMDKAEQIARQAAQFSENPHSPAAWPEPLPLLAQIAPEPYPLDALPTTMQAAVKEVQAFTKTPVALVAASALGALSVAAQAYVDVKRAEKLCGSVGVFLLTIADSGERKTTLDGFFTSAIRDYERNQALLAKPVLDKYRVDIDIWATERAGLLEKIKQGIKKQTDTSEQRTRLHTLEARKPMPPRVPQLLRGDDTPENLAWVLAQQWPSAGVISSEAGIIFGAHSMGQDSIMRNLALLNILWDGGTLSIGRRTSESFTVQGARLTVGLQIQQSTLRSFFSRSGGLPRGTGFLARMLLSWPVSTQGYRPFTEPPEEWPALAAFNQRIAAILANPAPVDAMGALSPAILTMTPEAKAGWVIFHDTIERELRKGGELYDVRDVAAKTADNAARLAALFHVLEYGLDGTIGTESFNGASRIAAWHLNEARRFFGELALSEAAADSIQLNNWLLDYCHKAGANSVSRREVQQFITPTHLREREKLNRALLELTELERIREISTGKRKDILVNPCLLRKASQ
ncbi:MAG: YfjI family protein [Alphaproteobacteria bacterium]